MPSVIGGNVHRTEGHLFQHSAETASAWVNELARGLGVDEQRYALRMMRAVLHAIRDRLTVPEVAHLASQLPELVRGILYEGWRPVPAPPRDEDADAFLDEVVAAAGLAGHSEASLGAAAVFTLLSAHVSPGEIEAVLAGLAAPVREVLRTAPSSI